MLLPVPTPKQLMARLDDIGRSLAAVGHGVALIGLGSVGRELDRLDTYSDLDFFVIVEDGWKAPFLADLGWLSAPAPLVYQLRNTSDGYKALYEDGIFCEFAVFERGELAGIPFAPGRIVWKRDGEDDVLANPIRPVPTADQRSQDWLLGEALTNLYVGICRFRRGEKLSGARFVQQFAVDRVIDLRELGVPQATARDPFSPERRVESRLPDLAPWWPRFVPGYERTPEAALALLDYLAARYPVNAAIAGAIRALCRPVAASD